MSSTPSFTTPSDHQAAGPYTVSQSASDINPLAPSPIAIGDVQGCCAPLDRLLAKIRENDEKRMAMGLANAESPLWFAGDLVNRGPASYETLLRLIGLGDRVTAVLGNHDLHLLAVAAGVRTQKKNDTIAGILSAPDSTALIDWIRHRPMAHFEHGILMVHAGVLPQWDVTQTLALAREVESGLRSADWKSFIGRLFGADGTSWHDSLTGDRRMRVIANALTRLRFCNEEGVMEWKANGGLDSALPGFKPWFEISRRRTAGTPIVFGHWAALGLTNREQVIGLDTGCVWGNALTAMRLTTDPLEREIFQVSCANTAV